jgi:hypothetical protein
MARKVVATPKPLAPSGPAATLVLGIAVLAPVEPFQGFGRQNLSQTNPRGVTSRSLVLNAEAPAAEVRAGLSTFLKNNTKRLPAWQEIVDFS